MKTSSWRWWVCSALILIAVTSVAAPVRIASGLYLLEGEFVPGRQPDGNSVIIAAPEGWIVVDTGRHPEHTRQLLAVAQPLRAVINTHWHLDHTGGNVLVRQVAPKARIYASGAIDAALKGFLANYAKQLEGAIAASKDPDEQQRYRTELGLLQAGSKLAPDEVISQSGTWTFARRKLDLHVESHAATAADLWVFEPMTKTVIAGDLVTLPFPFLDTACPSGWKDALDHVAAVDFTLLVPGHGAPMTRAQFDQYRRAFGNLVACGVSSRTNEECASGWLHDAGSLVKADEKFVRQALSYYLDSALRPGAKTACE